MISQINESLPLVELKQNSNLNLNLIDQSDVFSEKTFHACVARPLMTTTAETAAFFSVSVYIYSCVNIYKHGTQVTTIQTTNTVDFLELISSRTTTTTTMLQSYASHHWTLRVLLMFALGYLTSFPCLAGLILSIRITVHWAYYYSQQHQQQWQQQWHQCTCTFVFVLIFICMQLFISHELSFLFFSLTRARLI